MASDVDICNLALSRLGDDATVSELDPPEGSSSAEHCAQFYPIARDSLLEMHNWNFATIRIGGTPVTLPSNAGWLFAYAVPADCIQIIAILPPDVTDNYTANLGNIPGYRTYGPGDYSDDNAVLGRAVYTPQDFAIETASDGTSIILTNMEQASVRFIKRITDTTRFSPLFVDTLSWYLASMLAGPLLKGDVGAAESKRCLQFAMGLLGRASTSDARQQQIRPQQRVPWIGNR